MTGSSSVAAARPARGLSKRVGLMGCGLAAVCGIAIGAAHAQNLAPPAEKTLLPPAAQNPAPPVTQNPATTAGETSLSVLQGHVLFTPTDPQTGRGLDARQIVVTAGHKAVSTRGGAPRLSPMSHEEMTRLTAEVGRLRGLAPAPHSPTAPPPRNASRKPSSPPPTQSAVAPSPVATKKHSEKGDHHH